MSEEREPNPPCTQCGAIISNELRPLAWRLIGVCSQRCNESATNWTRLGIDLPKPDATALLVIGLGPFPMVCTTMGALVKIVPRWAKHQKSDSSIISRKGEVTRWGITVRKIPVYRGSRD